MTEESWIFLIDEFYYITGKGTVLSGELLNNITVWENILITSTDGSFRATTIMGIDVYRNGNMEETMNAHSGETVGIWVDILKEKINKGMGVFKEKDEVDEPSNDELIESIKNITENAVKTNASEINSQLAKYLVPLKSKEVELIYLDDYGDLCFDLWWEECDRFIEKKLMILKLDIVEECRLILGRIMSIRFPMK